MVIKAYIFILIISVLVVASAICDLRLSVTYMGYASEAYMVCPVCGALAIWHQEIPSCSLQRGARQTGTLKYAKFFRRFFALDVIFSPQKECRHTWDNYVPLLEKNVYYDYARRSVPDEFYTDCRKTENTFLVLCAFAFLCAVVTLVYNSLRTRRSGLLILWGAVIFFAFAFASLTLMPLGTPVTALTSQMRMFRHRAGRIGQDDADWSRIAFLLSEDAADSCQTGEEDHDERQKRKLFLLKEQARLAASIAPYKSDLAERYFYGRPVPEERDFAWRIARLAENQRIRYRGTDYAARYDTESLHEISTNSFGAVRATWKRGRTFSSDDELRSDYGETYFVRVDSSCEDESVPHWIPIRNIDGTSLSYDGRIYFRCSW